MGKLTPAELIDQYAALIASEKRQIMESLERIAEYSERLASAANQMRAGMA